MRLCVLLTFAIVLALDGLASIRDIDIPELQCGNETYEDVKLKVDLSKGSNIDRRVVCNQLQVKNSLRRLTRFYINRAMPDEFYRQAKRAEDFFDLISFKPSLLKRSRFDFTSENVFSIVESIKMKERMEVTLAGRDLDEDGPYVAYHKAGVAYIISDRLDRPECDHIETLVHEYMHHLSYQHGDNTAKGKENSVPYYFGMRAWALCEAGII